MLQETGRENEYLNSALERPRGIKNKEGVPPSGLIGLYFFVGAGGGKKGAWGVGASGYGFWWGETPSKIKDEGTVVLRVWEASLRKDMAVNNYVGTKNW